MKFHHSIIRRLYQSPLGNITLAATDQGLAGLWFDGQRHLPAELVGVSPWPLNASHKVLNQTCTQLGEYFAGRRQMFSLPLDLSGGTVFQQAVWQVLLAIPSGGTVSYSELSRRLGQPSAVRAAAAAVGRNPVSIVVPCHRVIGANGSLTGYAGGLDRKTALLKLEQCAT